MPKVIALICTYLSSAMGKDPRRKRLSYRGATRLALPTAKPTMLLPTIMPRTDNVKACHSAPTTKRASAARMAFFLPHLSAATPASGLAIRAKRLVQEVMRLLSNVLRGRFERSSPTETRVEDMTPVLRPRIRERQASRFGRRLGVSTHS